MRPENLSPRQAWQRYLDRRRPETTEESMKTFHYRLKLFVEWCEAEGIDAVSELGGWDFERYETYRRGHDLSPVTLRGEMQTLLNFVEYLERIEAVDEGTSDKIDPPATTREEESSDEKLAADEAHRLLDYYREHQHGTRRHVLLELFWHTGARMGAIRGLDRRDFDADDQYIAFVHRPDTGTTLKNKARGERLVSLSDTVTEAVQAYLRNPNRWDKRDEYGREPLVTSRQGRLSTNTTRRVCYEMTLPCTYGDCPHGKDPRACDWTNPNKASKCPSSRSPHRIRTGSITWQLNCGLPPAVVSERVNASPEVLRDHYDKAAEREEMEERRRSFNNRLTFEEDD
ncbi:Phage integrase family protein [Halobacterium jilantaiense]|uniref:Phage integrase family protein n=2 Tax=Halobacterium jilantaiense TaxID=355548 RepID=A0A1I0P927_9EURY|nr:Phage integrase family protein [Halobacterium jilantaiense]